MSDLDTKILILDFDYTIINYHSHNLLSKEYPFIYKQEDLEKIIDDLDSSCGFNNKSELENFLTEAFKKGYKVAIASFSGYPEIIKYILNKLDLDKELINKIYIESGHPNNPYNKTIGKEQHIYKIIQHFGLENIHPKNITLLDDDLTNIRLAQNAGYRAILVDKSDKQATYFQTALDDTQNKIYEEDNLLNNYNFRSMRTFSGGTPFILKENCGFSYNSKSNKSYSDLENLKKQKKVEKIINFFKK